MSQSLSQSLSQPMVGSAATTTATLLSSLTSSPTINSQSSQQPLLLSQNILTQSLTQSLTQTLNQSPKPNQTLMSTMSSPQVLTQPLSTGVDTQPTQQLTTSSTGSTSSTVNSSQTTVKNPVVILDKNRLQELVQEVDPSEQLEEEVEEMLLTIADDFIESLVSTSAMFAKHRKSSTLDVKDVQLALEKNWKMWIPGFGADDHQRHHKKAFLGEAHKQRLALIKKTLKKF